MTARCLPRKPEASLAHSPDVPTLEDTPCVAFWRRMGFGICGHR